MTIDTNQLRRTYDLGKRGVGIHVASDVRALCDEVDALRTRAEKAEAEVTTLRGLLKSFVDGGTAPVFEWVPMSEYGDDWQHVTHDGGETSIMRVCSFASGVDWLIWTGGSLASKEGTTPTLDEAKRAAEVAYLAMVRR